MDCRSNPAYLLHAAESALSPARNAAALAEILTIAPNPHPEGRARMQSDLQRTHTEHARSLIWC